MLVILGRECLHVDEIDLAAHILLLGKDGLDDEALLRPTSLQLTILTQLEVDVDDFPE